MGANVQQSDIQLETHGFEDFLEHTTTPYAHISLSMSPLPFYFDLNYEFAPDNEFTYDMLESETHLSWWNTGASSQEKDNIASCGNSDESNDTQVSVSMVYFNSKDSSTTSLSESKADAYKESSALGMSNISFIQKQTQPDHAEEKMQITCEYRCPKQHCRRRFDVKAEYLAHVKTHRLQVTCDCCCKTFSSQRNLARHLETIESRGPGHDCSQCSKVYSRKDALLRHIRTKHRP